MFNLGKYKTLVFDCDGVVLDSNQIKTQAFYNATQSYGHEFADQLVNYHLKNGGISRYKKFEYLLSEILQKPLDQQELDQLLNGFAKEVKKALLSCEVAVGLEELRKKTKHSKWLIVSGGDQGELREVFSDRDLDGLFDGGIFGSPDTKDIILEREIENQTITSPGLFLGDSKYDYQAAIQAGLDFVFISQWTEVSDWRSWATDKGIDYVQNLLDFAG